MRSHRLSQHSNRRDGAVDRTVEPRTTERGAGPLDRPRPDAPRGHDLSAKVDAPRVADGSKPSADAPVGPCAPPAMLTAGLNPGTPTIGYCLLAGTINQCQAPALCNAAGGWSLCTASQYRSRYRMQTPSYSPGWIAGCVRQGAAVIDVADTICSSCSASAGASAIVSSSCSGGTNDQSLPALNVGVGGHSSCRRIGAANVDAFWEAFAASSALRGGYCCK